VLLRVPKETAEADPSTDDRELLAA
jgi:hypothetical protein